MGAAAVRRGHRRHDGQPQAGARPPLGGAAREAIEGAGQEAGREAVALVADVHLDPVGGGAGADADGAGAVVQGVLDEVVERLAQAVASA